MSYKKDPKREGFYIVRHDRRDPITKKPFGLTRIKTKTEAEAKRVEKELVLKVDEMMRRKVIPTWKVVLDKYYASIEYSGLTNKTLKGRGYTLNAHTQVWFDRLVDTIKTPDVHDVLNTSFKDASEAHKKFFVKCVRSVFNFAVEQDYVVKNPTPLIKFKLSDKIKAVLNEEQILTLLRRSHETDYPWYPHYAAALFTGMRNGELFALTWDNVNLDERLIYVKSSWTKQDGFKSTKSGDDRVVEIAKPLVPILQELKLKSYDNVFVLPRLGKWENGDQARELRLFLTAIGLPVVRFHDLRASWATWLLSKGVAPSKVMVQGGWKDLDTMMIYMRKAGIDIKGSTSVLDFIKPQIEKDNVFQLK